MSLLPRLLCFATLLFVCLTPQTNTQAATRPFQNIGTIAAQQGLTNADSHFSVKDRPKPRSFAQDAKKEGFDVLSTIALILGIASLITVLNLYAIVIAPAGIILSIIALINLKKHPERKRAKKWAVIALVLNLVGLFLGLAFLAYLINYVFD